jgi:hypothetical protein
LGWEGSGGIECWGEEVGIEDGDREWCMI